ncbi:hypothetical protein [Rhodococcus sp. IEGM 1379]|uniref:hypothetical protein n=1 Tax=Rhodococcus sp. IEGM 1379 TaxID=3047086 RepID=UPI0024B7C632|nr:hypothetical protein [Rhodococcus sp. IEGM 1379]MDI9913869.1 hypothetical protein [Rhodococcus sp. IEGM 1379]
MSDDEINEGFTIPQGDTYLNNSELEGSIASFGSVSSGNQNGYPVLHQAAGEADYTVPRVDGVPVRILADQFTGPGGSTSSTATTPTRSRRTPRRRMLSSNLSTSTV